MLISSLTMYSGLRYTSVPFYGENVERLLSLGTDMYAVIGVDPRGQGAPPPPSKRTG